MSRFEPQHYDAIVLGAGAAGLMCAAVAGRRGRQVRVVEHSDSPGKKILISGGGRCNFTNIDTRPECYLSENPHFAKSALGRYRPADFIELVNRHRIAWHEKTLGQLFCDGSARQIVRMLLDECGKGDGKVDIGLGEKVRTVDHADGLFRLTLDGAVLTAPSLVLATGGPSIPKMGATGFAYEVARRFGLEIVNPRPALVPLTLGAKDACFTRLPGISAHGIVSLGKVSFEEAFLFTHRGLSGPAILQISSYWSPGDAIRIDMTPGQKKGWLTARKRTHPRISLRNTLAVVLPQRLSQAIAAELATSSGAPKDIGNIPDRDLVEIECRLSGWMFEPTGTEGFAKAEVTAGGIATVGLSSRTMEAKAIPGLYVIGEAVDVTGWLGGYNFQWAWASGHAAGHEI
jgi:predicted Rossmann fold flavoprotein